MSEQVHVHVWIWWGIKEGYDNWHCDCGEELNQPADCTGGR